MLVRLLGFRNEDRIIKLKLHLRKAEYFKNTKTNFLHRIAYLYHALILNHIARSYCSEIPVNVFGKGLIVWHPERIIVNSDAKVGDYCSISSGVIIAQAHDKNPIIGNHVELMVDSKVLGGITVADHVRIGACGLVVKSISEPDTTWAGIPAKMISYKGTIETPIPVSQL